MRKKWFAVEGESQIPPGSGQVIDLMPPEFREGLEGDEVTLLRIRGGVRIGIGENVDLSTTGDYKAHCQARAAIWAQAATTITATSPHEVDDVQDQGLLWAQDMGFASQVDLYAHGTAAVDHAGGVSLNGLFDRAVIDTKAQRYWARVPPGVLDPGGLLYAFDRSGDEGNGVSDMTIRHYFWCRTLWLIP